MPGTDWYSTGTILAIAAVAVPSAITVLGLILHATYVAGRLSTVLKAIENIYSILGAKVNKDDCLEAVHRIDRDIDDAHSKANQNATDIGHIQGKMNNKQPP